MIRTSSGDLTLRISQPIIHCLIERLQQTGTPLFHFMINLPRCIFVIRMRGQVPFFHHLQPRFRIRNHPLFPPSHGYSCADYSPRCPHIPKRSSSIQKRSFPSTSIASRKTYHLLHRNTPNIKRQHRILPYLRTRYCPFHSYKFSLYHRIASLIPFSKSYSGA